MLKSKLLHPGILRALASNGHGSMLLIADGNYPFSTGVSASAEKIYLNLAPGILTVPDVLKVISEAIPVESYTIMLPPDGSPQEIYEEFTRILGSDIPCNKVKRFEFYEMAMSAQTFLVIATGEKRRFANILLVVGVVRE